MNLYLTADLVGSPSGGGLVTAKESESLASLGPCEIWGRSNLTSPPGWAVTESDPWIWDQIGYQRVKAGMLKEIPSLIHFYAGTFTRTINRLKENGCKISYTAAAHDIQASKKAHEELGISFNYPHLVDPTLWAKYVGGYLAADALIVPSTHSAGVMRGFGYKGPIHIVPHGCDLPKETRTLPDKFVVGYLGSYGCDKHVISLLKAWKKLNYRDATLVLAGRDSTSPFVQELIRIFGGGDIVLRGWLDNISDFYNSISLYVQPSLSEGYGLEVLEAAAHGRPVICSDGAGAADLVRSHANCGVIYPAGDSDRLAELIDTAKRNWPLEGMGYLARKAAENYVWPKIQQKYVKVWKELLA